MGGTILMQVKGFTPAIDGLTKRYGLITSGVFGQIWRYCQMDDGICRASQNKIAEDLRLDRSTVIRHTELLVQDGYLEDLDPGVKNRPHRYKDTGKANVAATIEAQSGVAESNTESSGGVVKSNTGVAENNSRCCTKQHRGVVKSNMKIDSLRDSLRDTEEDAAGATFNPHPGGVGDKNIQPAGDAWASVQGQLAAEMGRSLLMAHVKALTPVAATITGDRVIFSLKAPDQQSADLITSRLGTRISKLLEFGVYAQPVDLTITA